MARWRWKPRARVKYWDEIGVSKRLSLGTTAGSNLNNDDPRGWHKIAYLEILARTSFAYLDTFDGHCVSLVLSIAHDSKCPFGAINPNAYVVGLKEIRRG